MSILLLVSVVSEGTTPGVPETHRYGHVMAVVLRNGLDVEEPLELVLRFLELYGLDRGSSPTGPSSFGVPDLRLANRHGARISAAQIAAITRRRRAIEAALRSIDPEASLAGAAPIPWLPLRRLFDGFADIHGVGFSKMTKALHPKRPALIPMLDSIVQRYLADDDLGPHAPYGERALELVRGYKRDLDRNRRALRALQRELARRDWVVTEVRILDILIVSGAQDGARPRSDSIDGMK
jgi:hypothetical protein